jgi:hypothetical protein
VRREDHQIRVGDRQTTAIMENVPDTPDPQTRTAVTQRIVAHVTRGWPRLGEPIMRHRGRYCYVSALLPGHREPTPILRLRYQRSADCRAIGIYLASSGQSTDHGTGVSCPIGVVKASGPLGGVKADG